MVLPVLSSFLKIAFGYAGSFAVPYKFQDWLSAGKESTCNAGDPGSILGSGRYPGEEIGYPLQYSWASLVAKMVKKKSTCSVGALGSIPWLGRSPGEGNGYSLQYSYLENSMDRGTLQATVLEVTKSQTWLSDFGKIYS